MTGKVIFGLQMQTDNKFTLAVNQPNSPYCSMSQQSCCLNKSTTHYGPNLFCLCPQAVNFGVNMSNCFWVLLGDWHILAGALSLTPAYCS